MNVTATMLCEGLGKNADQILQALKSIKPYASQLVLIDTGITDGADTFVKKHSPVPVRITEFEWCNDFAAARNFALRAAHAAGGDWALAIDTDEVLYGSPVSDNELGFTQFLASHYDVGLVRAKGGSYAKEQIIRLPAASRWAGAVHEAYGPVHEQKRTVIAGMCFTNAAKTPADMERKLTRDLVALRAAVVADSRDARAWFYLGRTFEDLGDLNEAVRTYYACLAIQDQWSEQSGWAAFRLAHCLCKLNRLHEAINACMHGLGREYRMPELTWLVAYCHYQLGNMHAAVFWAELAVTMGSGYNNVGVTRVNFSYQPAWYELPWDVLRYAYKALGENDAATKADEARTAAKDRRLGTEVITRTPNED